MRLTPQGKDMLHPLAGMGRHRNDPHPSTLRWSWQFDSKWIILGSLKNPSVLFCCSTSHIALLFPYRRRPTALKMWLVFSCKLLNSRVGGKRSSGWKMKEILLASQPAYSISGCPYSSRTKKCVVTQAPRRGARDLREISIPGPEG